ncbi:MAG: alginate export family protein, partial [Planctomycetaceae bacterium]
PWASLTYGELHRGFVRGQFGYLSYYKDDHYGRDQFGFPIPGASNHDWQGPYVDLGYYEMDLDAAVRKSGIGDAKNWSADLWIGRQFIYLGRGITFGLNSDGINLDWSYDKWGGQAFGSQSITRNSGGINSNVAYQLNHRRFYGGQIEYQGWDRRNLYSYILGQWDNSSGILATQNAYDTLHWGIGTAGEALFGEPGNEWGLPNLRYHSELIVEGGTQRFFGQDDDISASAVSTGLDYFWSTPGRPRVGVEYARASGDRSRAGPPQPSVGANVGGTTDSTFLGFGYLNTGASFSPLFTNLEFVHLSAAMRPFDDPERPYPEQPSWKNLEIGTSGFFYWRSEADAAISDIRANLTGDRYLGHEWDLHVNWKMSSDLFLLINYGIFFPHSGSFSPDQDNHRSRQFFTVNLNWLL